MKKTLDQIQEKAAMVLKLHSTPPQRYGTAFHVSPPFRDVREIEIEQLKNGPAHTADLERLSDVELQRLRALDISDVYLAWQLIHPDVTPLQICKTDEGEEADIEINNSALCIIIAAKGSIIRIADTIQNQKIAIRRVFVWQEEDSVLEWIALRSGNEFLNEKADIRLLGRNARLAVTHLTYGVDKNQADIEVKAHHEAPSAISDMKVKTVADQKHTGIYRGLIDITDNAKGSQGYQQGNALLLSRKAVVDMLPQLEINTNDVKCSHGVTTTHLDEAALFYMRSRGISEAEARKLAIIGFFNKGLSLTAGVQKQLEKIIRNGSDLA